MVSSISQASSNTSSKPIKTSIFYVNDIHGRVASMEKITSASKNFDTFEPSEKTDKLKLASGDIMLGENVNVNKAAGTFLKGNNFMASAVGNHEFDMNPEDFAKIIKDADYKLLGLNAKIDKTHVLDDKIISSYVQEENGNKYGIIGLMPFDLFKRIKRKENFDGLTIENIDNTAKELQIQVDSLKQQGVNKIILLSHIGYSNDAKLAQSVEGLDVILGGHSHDLIKDIEEGKNLFYSKKTGEPTIITQAGRDGNHFGVLNLEFNDNGVITKAQNNVVKTNSFSKNMAIKYVFDKILGASERVGTVAFAQEPPANVLIEENPNASFLADAIRSELNVDIGMVNAANLRGNFEAGEVYTRDVEGITPFKNKMTIINVTEKDLVDSLKYGAKSLTKPDKKPGLMQVSGLKYSITKSGQLVNASFIDKNGVENLIDINNPNMFKTYSVGIDDYCAKGKDGFTMLNKYDNPETVKFDFDKDKVAIDYIKKLNKPIEIKTDGRISVVEG